MSRFLFVLFLSFLSPVAAHAQCAMPSGPPVEAGVIVFNTDHKVMQYCNGDKWIGLRGGNSGGLPSCDDGDIAQFSGGAWTCNNGSGVDNLDASNIKSGNVPTARLGSGTADDTTFLRGDGTWQAVIWAGVSGKPSHTTATPPVCAGAGKALQWSGAAWSCADIEGGGGPTFDLVNGMHSSEQCTNLSGTVITSGSDKFCRFNGAACPAGWIRYQNWGTYPARTCSPGCGLGGGCTTVARAWGDNPAPTCGYTQRSFNGDYCENVGPATCTANVTQVGCY